MNVLCLSMHTWYDAWIDQMVTTHEVRESQQAPGRRGARAPRLPQIRTCPIKASGSSCHSFTA